MNSWPSLRQVFLEEPSKLYTMDVRKAFMHLVGGGKYSALPENKNYISPPTPTAAAREPSPPRRERKTILPPGTFGGGGTARSSVQMSPHCPATQSSCRRVRLVAEERPQCGLSHCSSNSGGWAVDWVWWLRRWRVWSATAALSPDCCR